VGQKQRQLPQRFNAAGLVVRAGAHVQLAQPHHQILNYFTFI
jgi:hypothetical protein